MRHSGRVRCSWCSAPRPRATSKRPSTRSAAAFKDAVPPQFEIDRARQAIEDLKPMFEQNKETLARAEIEVENLEKEVSTIQANLDREQKTIVALRDSIKTGEIRLTGHVKDTENRAKAELANRLDHFRYTSDLLKQKPTCSRPRGTQSRLPASSSRRFVARRSTLTAKLANIEASVAEDRVDPVEERLQLRQQRALSRPRKRYPTWSRDLTSWPAVPRSKAATAISMAPRPASILIATS